MPHFCHFLTSIFGHFNKSDEKNNECTFCNNQCNYLGFFLKGFFSLNSIDMVKQFKEGIMQNPKHPNKVSRRFLVRLKEVILVGICKKTVTKFKHHHNNSSSKHQKFPWLKIMEIKLFGKKLELHVRILSFRQGVK